MSNKINMKTVDGLEEGLANKADIDLSNSPYTTNRILEIPQDIKLTLNNGTLTLKAGSKLYVPNGFEQDGVTPKFDVVTIESDVIQTNGYNTQHSMMYQLSLNTFAPFIQGSNLFSGATDPTGVPTISCNYNTTLNKMRFTSDGGSSWSDVDYSLPFAITTSNNSQYTSIDQVFNGFGYIGSTMFALPGVKVQAPNGKNEDGTYKSNILTVNNVETVTFTSADYPKGQPFIIRPDTAPCLFYANWHFDETSGYVVTDSGVISNAGGICVAGSISADAGKITRLVAPNVDSVANSNASNFSQAGRSYLSGLGKPKRSILLTTGASGSVYRAPANGWFRVTANPYPNTYGRLRTPCLAPVFINTGSSGPIDMEIYAPVSKGEAVIYDYSGSFYSINSIQFIYDEGEN